MKYVATSAILPVLVCYGPRLVRGRTPSLWALATALGTSILLLVPLASGAGPSADRLRLREADLASKSRSALLGLYAVESSLDRARGNLAALQAQAGQLRRERVATRARLTIAVRAFHLSQQQLAERLRALYEQESVDPLEIVLGASSLEEAMTGIDSLNRLASQNRSVIEQTRRARASLAVLSRALAEHQAELAKLQAAAQQRASSLGRAQAARQAYVARLGSERRLTAEQIGALAVQAQVVEAKAAQLTIQQGSPPGAVDPPELASAPVPLGARTITVLATGYSLGGHTSTGIPTGWGVVAVDASLIPLGTRLTIPGYGEGVAADTGNGVRGPMIDLWFPTTAQAFAWGRRTVTIALH